MKHEELGIIKDVNVGMRDSSKPICWFTIELLGGTTLQVISIEEMKELIEESQVYRLTDLNNKPCIVETNGFSIKFLKMK